MRSNSRAVAINMAALAALTTGNLLADTSSIVLQTGITNSPGPGGGLFNSIQDRPAINSSGQVAIQGGIAGSNDGTNSMVLRAETFGSLIPIASNGQAAPGSGGGAFSGFQYPTINNNGQVMPLGYLIGTSDGAGFGYFRGDGTTLTSLLRQKAAAPGNGGGIINDPFAWNFSNTGAVTLVAGVTGGPQGIFQGDGTSLIALVRDGQAAPGAGGGTFAGLTTPNTNNLGQTAFNSAVIGTNNGTNQGIFRYNAGLSEVVRNAQAAPGGGTYSGFTGIPLLNNAGQIAFSASLNGAGDGATNGFFRANPGGTTTAIARHNNPAPGGGTFGVSFGTNDFLQNDKGQVLFQSGISNAPDGSQFGIFRGDGSNLDAIARSGQTVPGGGTLSAVGGDMAFTNGGAALFSGFLSNTPDGTADNQALYLGDGRDLIQVVRKGQALSSSIVTSFVINVYTYANGFNAVNDRGQVAYTAVLADGSSAVVRYTPTLHFREQFGGSWDNGNNWTLGINPASVHEVFIDPQFGANVSGPAANVTIASLTVAGKSGTATLDMNAGGQLLVSGVTTVKSTGQLLVNSGKFLGGSVVNDGYFSVAVGGQLSVSSFINNNNFNISGPSAVGGPITNNGFMNVSHTTLTGGQLTNTVQLTLDAATVSNSIINEVGAVLTARGTVNSLITNRGTLNTSGLLTIQSMNNSGLVTINSGSSIALGTITNTGVITLAGGGITGAINNGPGGIVQGGGGITSLVTNNTGGLIFANSAIYPLTIGNVSTNQAGARIRVADGSSLNLGSSFSNLGLVTLGGDNANLTMTGNQTISNNNTGIISGAGTIVAAVNNSGTLRAEDGTLVITGVSGSNQTSGLIQVNEDATLLLAQGITNSSGTINVSGGSFINNTVSTFSNNGKISGFGTFTTNQWSNQGTMTFTGGFSTINGTVTNGSTRKIEVANNPALFTGNVTNFGILKNTKTSITFGGTYTENGTFISDPADNFFSSVNIGENGAWVGGVGDRFFLTGDLLSESKNKSGWQTAEAELRLMGGVRHLLSISGADRGTSFDGYSDNFGWGTLVVDAGDSISLSDGDEAPGGGLYVHRLLLGGGVGQISNIQGNGLNVYYDLGDSANAYLGGQTYALAGGGSISPVPEPGMMLLGMLGTTTLLIRRRPLGRR